MALVVNCQEVTPGLRAWEHFCTTCRQTVSLQPQAHEDVHDAAEARRATGKGSTPFTH